MAQRLEDFFADTPASSAPIKPPPQRLESFFQGDQTTPLPQGTEFSIPQGQADETARMRAAGQIKDIETGRSWSHDANGNFGPTIDPTKASKLSSSQKLAIYQAHQQAVAGRSANPQSYEQMASQVKQASLADNNPWVNFTGGANRAIAGVLPATVGQFAPNLGNRMAENVENTYATDPDSVAGMAGRVAGGLVPATLGPGAYAALMAAQATGEARMEVEKLRAAGHVISPNQESMYIATKAALAGATGKISAGAMTGGKGLVNAVATGAADIGTNAAAGNAAAIGTGIDPNRDLIEGVPQAMLEGGAGTGLGHTIHGLIGRQTVQSPTPQEQLPNEKPSNVGPNREVYQKAIEDNLRRQMGMDKLAETKAKINDLGAAQDEQIKAHDAAVNQLDINAIPAQPAAASSHPAELADAKQVGEWYGQTFKDPNNAGIIEAMASTHPGKYKLMDVPVDKIDPNSIMDTDTNQEKVAAISHLSPEDRAELPPLIGVGEGDKVKVADGTHRFEAAKLAGDKTVPMYVPEKFANDLSKLKPNVSGEEPNLGAKTAPESQTFKTGPAVEAKAVESEPTTSEVPQKYSHGANDTLTPMLAEMRDINERAAGRVFEAEATARKKTAARQAEFGPYANELDKYFGSNPDPRTNQTFYEVQKAMRDGDIEKAKSLVPEKLWPAIEKGPEMSRNILEERKAAGIATQERENHVHYVVKDYKALQKLFGKETPGPIKAAWDAEMAQTRKPLTAERKTELANDVLNRRRGERNKPGFERSRTEMEFTPEVASNYKPFWQSQSEYLSRATIDTERTKLLGNDKTNPTESLGHILAQETESGKLSGEGAARFNELLQTHLGSKPLGKATKLARDTIHLALNQVGTAIKNFVDMGLTAGKAGIGNTLKATKIVLTRDEGRLMLRQVGLNDLGTEFRDPSKMGKLVNFTLTISGMKHFDIFTKEIRMNAENLHFKDMVKTPEGETKFAKQYKDFLGKDYEATVAALKSGKNNWQTEKLGAAELSRTQPLYNVNMTPAQARSSGLGRLAYTFKPYLLHQIDFLRREIGRDLATPGQRIQGLQKLAGYSVLMGLAGFSANAITNLLHGKKEEIPEQIANAFLGIVNLSTSSLKGGPSEVIQHFIGVPTPFVNDVAHDVKGPYTAKTTRVFKNGSWQEETHREFTGAKTIKDLPLGLIGEIAYYHTPLGAGYYSEAKDADKVFREKLTELKQTAEDADAAGDSATARYLIDMYNRQAAGDPEKKIRPVTPGTFQRAKQTSIRSQQKVAHAAKP